jgi:F0F1-type ATP synthase assembly protein I
MNDFLKIIIFFTILLVFAFLSSKIKLNRKKGSFISYLNISGISYILLGLLIGWGFKDIFSGKNLYYISPFLIFLIVYIGFLSGANIILRELIKYPAKFYVLIMFYCFISYWTVFYPLSLINNHLNIGLNTELIKLLATMSLLSTPFYFYFFNIKDKTQKSKYFIISGVSNFISLILLGILFFKNIDIRISTINIDLTLVIILLTLILSLILYSLLNSKMKIEEIQTITIGILAFAGGIAVFSNITAISLAAFLGLSYINLPYRIQEFKLTPHLISFEKPVFIILIIFSVFIPSNYSVNLIIISLLFLTARLLSRIFFHYLLKIFGYKSSILYLFPIGTLAIPFSLSIYFILPQTGKTFLAITIISVLINETISGLFHKKKEKTL